MEPDDKLCGLLRTIQSAGINNEEYEGGLRKEQSRRRGWRAQQAGYGVGAGCEIVDDCRALPLLQRTRVASASPEVY